MRSSTRQNKVNVLVVWLSFWCLTSAANECADKDQSGQCDLLDCDAFKNHARTYCARTCGVCRDCQETLTNCTDYGQNVCTDHRDWAVDNCPRYCKFCDCYDKYNCSTLGPNACTKFDEIAHIYCRQYCHFCNEIFHPDAFKTNDTSIPHVSKQSSTLRTTTTTTTTTPSSITPGSANGHRTHRCDKLALIEHVASNTVVTHPLSGPCLDGTRAQSEAVINRFCMAPDVTSWRQGPKVLDNCDTIPMYSAIATFIFDRYPRDARAMSGVFLGCEAGGFRAIFQICGYSPTIEHLTQAGGGQYVQNPEHFFAIEW